MSEVCQNCEGYYDTVYRMPDDVWEKLTGHADGGGLLCPACCDLLARRVGLELYWEAAIGEYPIAAERERCAEKADEIAATFLEGAELLSSPALIRNAHAMGAAAGYVAEKIRAGPGEGE